MADTSGSADSTKKELAKEIYKDLVHPAAQSTGELVALVPRAVKVALQPLEKWILQGEYNLAQTQKLLDEKLKNVDPKNICSPEAHIAVPALQYINYCMDNDELRDMYANLLANSMNKVVKNGVHPAFVEIIKQLSPDEAKILKCMQKKDIIASIGIGISDKNRQWIELRRNFSDIVIEAGCEQPLKFTQYFDNLIRLGLVSHGEKGTEIASGNEYNRLINHPIVSEIKDFISNKSEGKYALRIEKGYLYLTGFGKAFCDICINGTEKVSENTKTE